MADNSDLKKTLGKLLEKHNNEQAELQGLNGRFASYITKILSLEQQNQALKGKLQQLQQLQSHESKRVTELYEEEMNSLRLQVQTETQNRSNLELELDDIKDSLQKANNEKEEALKKLNSLKEDLDAPTRASKALEAENKRLENEIAFQKKIHEEEIQNLEMQFKEMKNNVQTDGANSDLKVALQELKKQFQKTANTKSETEEWYKSKMSEMKETANNNNETLMKLRQENTNLNNQSKKNLHEISSLTATIKEKEEHIQALQETVTNLEADKNKMKDDMEIQLLEYQDLLEEKGTLEEEIAIYRTLLEEVERRTQGSENSPEPSDPPCTASSGL